MSECLLRVELSEPVCGLLKTIVSDVAAYQRELIAALDVEMLNPDPRPGRIALCASEMERCWEFRRSVVAALLPREDR